MAENKTAKTPTDGGTGFIDGVWYGPRYGTALTCISSKLPQREWVGLTDEEIDDCEEEVGIPQYEISSADLYAFARAIEAKLKEKNHFGVEE